MDVLKYSAMAATAGMTDQKTIADILTSVLNAYADSGLKAGNAIDVLNTIITRGKLDWSAITSTIGIGATTAEAAGLKFTEFAAAMATLSGVVGNSGIRRMSNDLNTTGSRRRNMTFQYWQTRGNSRTDNPEPSHLARDGRRNDLMPVPSLCAA